MGSSASPKSNDVMGASFAGIVHACGILRAYQTQVNFCSIHQAGAMASKSPCRGKLFTQALYEYSQCRRLVRHVSISSLIAGRQC